MQLKSMISALHHSRVDGTKSNCFRQGKKAAVFGWEAIEGMLRREIQRIQSGQLARVPGLKESFVHRDSWTRLNVKPAKIMQVGSLSLSFSLCLSLSLSHSLSHSFSLCLSLAPSVSCLSFFLILHYHRVTDT